ncbi:FxsA family protein [Candidatus Sumerlaeota bacterium]|nr:FxsA family protein [Candidatus Sumerlaeota bacterium]
MMLAKLILLFLVTTLVEFALMFWIGSIIGLWATIGVIIVTSVIGGAMARTQGAMIWFRIQQELMQGRLPGDAMIEGLLILMGGCLLVTPGFLTDFIGFATLIPISRGWMRRQVKNFFKGRLKVVQESQQPFMFFGSGFPPGGMASPGAQNDSDVIDTDDWEER